MASSGKTEGSFGLGGGLLGGAVVNIWPPMGYLVMAVGAILMLVGARNWHKERKASGLRVMEPSHLITIGVIGAAFFALVAVAGIVWQWHETSAVRLVTSQPPQTTGSPFPSPLAATTVQWNQIFGISRGTDIVQGLFLDGKGPASRSITMKDAFLESGITGEVIKMKVGSTNLLDDTFPISEANPIPPNGFIRLVAVMNPSAPNQGLPNKEFLEHWRTVWFNAIYEGEKPDRILFDEKMMGSYFPGLSGPHVTRR